MRPERGRKHGFRAMRLLERALERLSAQVGPRLSRRTDDARRTNVVTSVNVGTQNSSRVVVADQRTSVRQGGDRTTAEEHNG